MTTLSNPALAPLPSSLKQLFQIQTIMDLIDDDSEYTSDTEWEDTEEVSEADHTSAENELGGNLVEAAAEAQRQRDMFAKVDRSSYSDLTRVRTQPGNLSKLFHPDPEMFPENHPYRYSRSTQDILAHIWGPLPSLQFSKSAAAVPVAATVTAHGVGSPIQNGRQRSPLRLKARPEDVEDSDSGEEDDNKVHMSESVAKERLAALHGARRPAQPSKLSQQQTTEPKKPNGKNTTSGLSSQRPETVGTNLGNQPTTRPVTGPPRVVSEPIAIGFPYNLPPPQPPSTPRTTRRNMLTHELSESLRRNLLWERQVTKYRPIRRTVSNAPTPNLPRAIGGGIIKGYEGGKAVLDYSLEGQSNSLTRDSNVVNRVMSDQDLEARLKQIAAKNRSWSNNFHVSGW